jgi:hypothetical protein
MDDPPIVHMLQPVGNSHDLASRMKIDEIAVERGTTYQLQPIDFGVLVKAFFET